MKNSVKSLLALVCICAVVAVALAATNTLTALRIENNENAKADEVLKNLLPDGGKLTKIENLDSYTLPQTVNEAHRAENGGYVIKVTVRGYVGNIVILCGISAEGKVIKTQYLDSETKEIGGAALKILVDRVIGKDSESIDGVDTVSRATITSTAFRSAVKDALNAAIILGGGEADLRTEEEKLNDGLNEALPSAEGKFDKYFFVEVIEGIDAVYTAQNNTGAVCVIGEQFIAVKANGEVITECSDDIATKVSEAIKKVYSTVTTDINLQDYEGLPSQLISAKRTESGNYIIEINGVGYGILGGNKYHPASGKYIVIKVAISKDGKIIDCLTVSQGETDKIGSLCENEAFYGQFDGKTEENYNDIDAIAGATITTNGYKEAIMRAFACVKIFENGANNG